MTTALRTILVLTVALSSTCSTTSWPGRALRRTRSSYSPGVSLSREIPEQTETPGPIPTIDSLWVAHPPSDGALPLTGQTEGVCRQACSLRV